MNRYLGLDRKSSVNRFNREFHGQPQGTELLIRLLKRRHNEGTL